MTFDELLTLVDDRSAALRSAAAAASSLEARVPGCPDWTLDDLIRHLGAVQRYWAVVTRLADTSAPPTAEQSGDIDPQGDLLRWSAESTALLVDALRRPGRKAPPGRGGPTPARR